MPVDGGSSSTLGGVVGREGSTPEHSAWSRDVYLSAATSFAPSDAQRNLLRRDRVRLARKASEPSRIARYPPRTLSEDTKTRVRGRIGQTGFMVCRGGSMPSGDAGHCRMQRRTRQNRHDGHKSLV